MHENLAALLWILIKDYLQIVLKNLELGELISFEGQAMFKDTNLYAVWYLLN